MTAGTSYTIERAFRHRQMGLWIVLGREKDFETQGLTLGRAVPDGGTCQAPPPAQFSLRLVATEDRFSIESARY